VAPADQHARGARPSTRSASSICRKAAGGSPLPRTNAVRAPGRGAGVGNAHRAAMRCDLDTSSGPSPRYRGEVE
jgi:hypothetical protein